MLAIWRLSLVILSAGALSACATRSVGPVPLPIAATEFDLNGDRLIGREEAGPILRPRFAEVDRDHSGALDGRELGDYFAALAAPRAAPPSSFAADKVPAVVSSQDIDAGLRTMTEDIAVPGGALICGSQGREIYRHGFGAISDTTSVPIASASKWISAVILMQSVEAGSVRLDAPLSTYLPTAPAGWREMTLRQMFSHSAGAPRSHALRYPPDMSAAELARTLMAGRPAAVPGSAFAYGGESMQVGAFAVETATGSSWRQLFDRGFRSRLGLKDISFRHPIWYDPAREIVTPNVAAGVWSSASDYFQILSALAFPTAETRLLSDASLSEMESDYTSGLSQTFRPPGIHDDWSYGLGLWCERRAGNRCQSISSAGAFGTYPWIDRTTGSYGVLVTLGDVKTALPYALKLRKMCERLPAPAL